MCAFLLPSGTLKHMCLRTIGLKFTWYKENRTSAQKTRITYPHTQKQDSKRTQFNGFLFLHKLKYRWPQVEWGLRMKSFSHIVLLISTSRIQLVLHPHCFPLGLQSLRLAINWWQSRSPRSSSGPGSLRPVFWSTHQHFPRWPSRAGWHCKHKDKGVILVL